MEILGIVLSLVLLCVVCFKGMSPLWTAPICAILVAATNGLPIFESFAGTYMHGFASFAEGYLMIFLLGGIFGKMMELTGAAEAVGETVIKLVGKKRALLAVILACSVMTYGGISLFIVMFVIYPIAAAAFRESNIPRQLFPGAYAVGCYTFTMTGLPGSPQIQNLIPIEFFGTTPMAAPTLGIICSVLLFGLGYAWMVYREKKLTGQGLGWTENPNDTSSGALEVPRMNKYCAFLPLLTVVIVLNVFGMDATISLAAGILVNIVCGFKLVAGQKIINTMNDGAIASLQISLVTAAVVGFGSVVKTTDTFNTLADTVFGLPISPLLVVMIAVNVLAGICGSASGGMSIALSVLGDRIIALSQSTGIPLSVFHRITSLSSGGLDTLPPGVAALMYYCGCSYKESYIDVFVTSVLLPIVVTLIGIAMVSVGIA